MSALLPRLAAGSVTAAVALLVLGAPTAALAAPGNEKARTGAAQAQERPSPQATPAAAGSAGGAAAGRSAAAPAGKDAAATSAAKPAEDQRGRSQAVREKAKQARAAGDNGRAQGNGRADGARAQVPTAPAKAAKDAAEDAVDADPRGNNGTFKVDGSVLDTGHGNEPHVSCAFRLNFFGYDAGQLANIVFTAVAPTPGASTAVDGLQLISTTAAKGGVYGGSYPVAGTWTAADLGLDPTQAQHIKVSVESVNADGSDVPGGAKHKVFWLEPCGAAAPAEDAAAVAPAVVAPASLPVMGPFIGPRRTLAGAPTQSAATAPAAQVLSATVTAQAAGPATVVAAPFSLPQGSARATQPATLPFTGSPQLVALLTGGLVSLVFGGGLVVATRRAA